MVLLDKRKWFIVRAAVQMAFGIYWDDGFDTSYLDFNLNSYEVITAGNEAAILAYVDGSEDNGGNSNLFVNPQKDYCMLAFRGRNYDTDNYPNACCDAWWDTSCWDNSYETCWKAIRDDVQDDARAIRDSAFTQSVFNGDSYKCEGFNDELATDFHDFTLGTLKNKVVTCMDTCKTDNNGEECDLYITGHSQGGVYAQMMAIRLYKAMQMARNIEPYIITFGTPPMYDSSTSQCPYLPSSDDHILQFVNIGGYDSDGVTYDVVPSIGLDYSARHSETGYIILLNGDDESVYKIRGPNDDHTNYGTPDYTYSWDSDADREKLDLHYANEYKNRIEDIITYIVDSESNISHENGFENMWCTKDEQCHDNTCGYTVTETTRICFIICWNESDKVNWSKC